jgi:Ner family transcriptional regulator
MPSTEMDRSDQNGSEEPRAPHRAEIIAAIHMRGMSLTRLGERHGLAESTLRAALQKPRTPSNRIIAKFLGVPMHELWPDWFDERGRLITQRDPAKATTTRTSPNRDAA